jgi:hypothetical protein
MQTVLPAVEIHEELTRADAEKYVDEVRRYGLGRIVWNVIIREELPEHERSFLERLCGLNKEFKSVSETSEDYVQRIIRTGNCYERQDKVFAVKSRIGLVFDSRFEETVKSAGRLSVLYTEEGGIPGIIYGDTQSFDLEVQVREHSFVLNYRCWRFADDLLIGLSRQIAKPDKVNIYCL